MYEHLHTFVNHGMAGMVRVDFWAGRSDRLRYTLGLVLNDNDARPAVFDGEDYRPAPSYDLSTAVGMRSAVQAFLGFYAAYAEYGPDSSESPDDFSPRQWDHLRAFADDLALLSDDAD